MTEQSRTAIPNEVYDLASILYHALQGAQTYDKYIEDAGGNEQLAEFFRTAKSGFRRLATWDRVDLDGR